MMTEPLSEKVVRLETQMTSVSSDIAEVKGLVQTVITKVDTLANVQNDVTLLRRDIQAQQEELADLKRRRFRDGVIFPTVSAVSGSVLTLLIMFYISHS